MKFKVGNQEFEVKDEEVTKAITEKKDIIELSADAVVRTPADETRFVENMKKDARVEGVEIAVKKARESMGLSFEGKTVDNLITAVSEKVKKESGESETEKVTKLELKIKEKDKAIQAAVSRATTAEGEVKSLKSSYSIDRALDQYIPKETLLPLDDVKTIVKAKLKFAENDKGVIEVFNLDGTPIVNQTTRDALPVKEAIEDFFRSNVHYMKSPDGGGNGGDSGKGGKDGKITIEDFNKDMQSKGFEINSREYDTELNKAIAAKTIDLD